MSNSIAIAFHDLGMCIDIFTLTFEFFMYIIGSSHYLMGKTITTSNLLSTLLKRKRVLNQILSPKYKTSAFLSQFNAL